MGKARGRERRDREVSLGSREGSFLRLQLRERKRSSYDYATTFYPLWAGFASNEQARALEANLQLFEQPGGIVMSR